VVLQFHYKEEFGGQDLAKHRYKKVLLKFKGVSLKSKVGTTNYGCADYFDCTHPNFNDRAYERQSRVLLMDSGMWRLPYLKATMLVF
jgi:hypothetical protein